MVIAGALVRDARLRSGLTQTELAELAGVAQSVISAYESSRREPGVDTLRRLIFAAGFDLELGLVPAVARSPLRMRVERHRRELIAAIASSGGSNVRLFGSVARGDDVASSDVDLLIDVDSTVGLFELGRMRAEAERILSNAVDIVPANGLKPDVAGRVFAEAVRL